MDIRDFKSIQKKYSPSLMWDWCGRPEGEEIDSFLKLLSEAGFKSAVIRPKIRLEYPYLGRDYFELIRTAARRSAVHGLELYICDDDSDASGTGGGEVTSVYEYREKELVLVKKENLKDNDIVIFKHEEEYAVARETSSLRSDICNDFVWEAFAKVSYDAYRHNCTRFIGEEIKGFLSSVSFSCDIPYSEKVYDSFREKSNAHFDLFENEDSRKEYFTEIENAAVKNFFAKTHAVCTSMGAVFAGSVNGKLLSKQKFYAACDMPFSMLCTDNPDIVGIKLLTSMEKPSAVLIKAPSFSHAEERMRGIFLAAVLGCQNIIFDSVPYSFADCEKYEKYKFSLSDGEKHISDCTSRLMRLNNETDIIGNVCLVYPHSQIKALSQDEFDNAYKAFTVIVKKLLSKGVPFKIIEDEYLTDITKNTFDEIITPDLTAPEKFSYTYESNISFGDFEEVCISERTDGNLDYFLVYFSKDFNGKVRFCGSGELFYLNHESGEIYKIPLDNGYFNAEFCSGCLAVFMAGADIYADDVSLIEGGAVFGSITEKNSLSPVLFSVDENILPLKNVNACFGKKAARSETTDSLCERYHKLHDGELVRLKYPFYIHTNKYEKLYAIIENAGNMDEILLNGKSLLLTNIGHSLYKCDITPFISDGKNTFSLEYRKSSKYLTDEKQLRKKTFSALGSVGLEPVYITGRFNTDGNEIFPCTEGISDLLNMPYYFGNAVYKLTLPKLCSGSCLKLTGSFDACKIKIGRREKQVFSSPALIELFELDSDAVCEITLSNTPKNLFSRENEKIEPFGITSAALCAVDCSV